MEYILGEHTNVELYSNWTDDYLDGLNTSIYPFPNIIWHVKSTPEVVIKAFALIIIAVPGIMMNAVILVTLMKHRWLWTPSYLLLGNMAFVDFITLVFCPWFMLVRDIFQNFELKNFGCRFEGFLQATCLLENVFSVVLVSYDRLAAACLPSEARVTKCAAPKLIAASWIIACLFALPWAISREYVERQWLDHLESFCVESPEVLTIYWQFILLLLVYVPLGTMTVTYGAIIWRLVMSARKLSSRGGGQLVTRAKGRTLKVAAVLLLADILCRIPYSILIYRRNRSSMEINWVDGPFSILWFAANSLLFLNCTINPLIYGFANSKLLKAMDRTPGIACCKFSSWCCACAMNTNKERAYIQQGNNTEKIFVIEASPRPGKKLSKVIKNFLHINADGIELSIGQNDEFTNKTKVTPMRTEPFENKPEVKPDSENNNDKDTKDEQITEQEKL